MIKKTDFNNTFEDSLNRRSIELRDQSRALIGDYFYTLLSKNEQINLTGYNKVEDFVDFHLIDAIKLLDIIDPPQACVIYDIGSGAGLPGLLFNMLRPDISVNMVESNRKKSDFIEQVIIDLRLDNCYIINSRAEDAAHSELYREKGDIAVARAVGSLSTALELTAGFVRKNGILLLPRGAEENITEIATKPSQIIRLPVSKGL